MKQGLLKGILLASIIGLASCGGADTTGDSSGLGGDGSGSGTGTGTGTGTGPSITPSNVADTKVKDEVVNMIDLLSKKMNTVTQAVCTSNSSKAALDVLRAFVRELMADQLLPQMQDNLIPLAMGGLEALGSLNNAITELRQASKLSGYLVSQVLWIIKSVISSTAYDPICLSGAPRWGIVYEGAAFAKTNFVADSLIINKAPGTITTKVDANALCDNTFAKGTQPVWKDLAPICKEILGAGKPVVTYTLDASNQLAVDIKLDEGKIVFINILANPERTRFTMEFDLNRVMDIANAIGYGKFLGKESVFSGKVGIELDLAAANGIEAKIVLKDGLVVKPVLYNNGKKRLTLNVTVKPGAAETGQSIYAGIENSGKLFAKEVALGQVVIGLGFESDLGIGPMEFTLQKVSVSAEAFGKPLLTKINNLSLGGPVMWTSNGKPVCTIDINKAQSYTVSTTIRENGGQYMLTPIPGLFVTAACQPVAGMLPASLDALFKTYTMDFGKAEFALDGSQAGLLDLVAPFLPN